MKYSSCYIPRLLYWIAALSFTSLRLKIGILKEKFWYSRKELKENVKVLTKRIFFKTGVNQFLKMFLKCSCLLKKQSKWNWNSPLWKTSKWDALKFKHNFPSPEPKCSQSQYFTDISTLTKNSFTIGHGTLSSVSARNAITRKRNWKIPREKSNQAGLQRWGAGGRSVWRARLPPAAEQQVSTCSWHSSAAVGPHHLLLLLRLAVHDVCCSGKPTLPRTLQDASAISYSRLARAARSNAAFVAQHCIAERLQSASSMPVRTHYSCTIAEVSPGATAKLQLFISYLISRSHFFLVGDTKTRINGN